MRIQELNDEYTNDYRELRLKGLREEPTSFGATYEEEVSYPTVIFEEQLSSSSRIIFGAFEDEQLVGILTLTTNKEKKQVHLAELTGFYIHPEYRGRGMSKPIMASAIMRAKELKCEQIHLSVDIENTRAKNLYISFGFEIIGMEKEILKIAENQYIDEYRMALYFYEWNESNEE